MQYNFFKILFRPIKTAHFRILLIAAMSLLIIPTVGRSFELSTGAGALDEGDDHTRAAAMLHVKFDNSWMARSYLWGRSYGPVTETSGIISAGKQGPIFGSKSLTAAVGLSVMAENTSISYKDNPKDDSSFTSTNLGLLLGLNYTIFSTRLIKVSASWDSHLFAASDAIIFLVTGRKQIVGLTAGVSF